jgi:hypothetical protein
MSKKRIRVVPVGTPISTRDQLRLNSSERQRRHRAIARRSRVWRMINCERSPEMRMLTGLLHIKEQELRRCIGHRRSLEFESTTDGG